MSLQICSPALIKIGQGVPQESANSHLRTALLIRPAVHGVAGRSVQNCTLSGNAPLRTAGAFFFSCNIRLVYSAIGPH
jgi:hypothetical protein